MNTKPKIISSPAVAESPDEVYLRNMAKIKVTQQKLAGSVSSTPVELVGSAREVASYFGLTEKECPELRRAIEVNAAKSQLALERVKDTQKLDEASKLKVTPTKDLLVEFDGLFGGPVIEQEGCL